MLAHNKRAGTSLNWTVARPSRRAGTNLLLAPEQTRPPGTFRSPYTKRKRGVSVDTTFPDGGKISIQREHSTAIPELALRAWPVFVLSLRLDWVSFVLLSPLVERFFILEDDI